MTTLLKTSKQYRTVEPQFDLQAEIISCFEQLDIDRLANLVNREDLFDDSIIWKMLAHYKKVFLYITELQGITRLKSKKAICNGCDEGMEVISFVNEFGYAHFGIRFITENGVLTEIAQCSDFNGHFRSLIESQSTEYAVPVIL